MINDKDRSQLLRMAGNIAGSLAGADLTAFGSFNSDAIASGSVELAYEILKAVDKKVEKSWEELDINQSSHGVDIVRHLKGTPTLGTELYKPIKGTMGGTN